MFRDVLYGSVVCPCPAVFVVRGCGVLEEVYRCFAIVICFSVVNVYLDHLKFYVVCINSRRYVLFVVNVMLSLMSVMSPTSCLVQTYRCALM